MSMTTDHFADRIEGAALIARGRLMDRLHEAGVPPERCRRLADRATVRFIPFGREGGPAVRARLHKGHLKPEEVERLDDRAAVVPVSLDEIPVEEEPLPEPRGAGS